MGSIRVIRKGEQLGKAEKRNQEKINWLKQYKYIDSRIDELVREKEAWMTKATHITPTLSLAPGGGQKKDILAEVIDKVSEIEAEIVKSIDGLVDLRQEIQKVISQLDNADQKSVLRLRYIEGKHWEQIACEIDRSYRWVLRLHGRALCEINIEKNEKRP